MESIHIHGGIPLQGQVKIQGSKNAALPILAATVLIPGISLVKNCPRIADVFHMQTLLEHIGCKTSWEGKNLRVDAKGVKGNKMQGKEVTGMRSSIILLGALLGRVGEAAMEYPGGCVIGKRPIDLHLQALERMNVVMEEKEDTLYARTTALTGNMQELKFPSVGATENIILAAVTAKGRTIIKGAAREPEIIALCEFLKDAGALIEGIGTSNISINGVTQLEEIQYTIPADRIVAGTYLLGCLIAKGCVLLQDAPVKHMQALLRETERMGAVWQETKEGIYVESTHRLKGIPYLKTEVYPGFPTDLQSPLLAALSTAGGESLIEETIFENRFRMVKELQKMGAKIKIEGSKARIQGVSGLRGAKVEAEELRGGAALVMAGLGAVQHTVVENCGYIYRGYENIGKDLRELGARVYSV